MDHPAKPKAVILFSGGLDSTTCVKIAESEGFTPELISFDYGQKHRVELEAAAAFAHRHAYPFKLIEIQSLGKLGGSALTDAEKSIEDYKHDGKIPATYVPARNIIFLSIALGYAEIIAAKAIYIGANAVDYSGYPDCRPAFLKAYQTVMQEGTKAGVEGSAIELKTPILMLSKAEIIKLGTALGIDYSETVSCYRANQQGQACGTCDSCVLRKKGFEDAALPDVTRYY